jgi:restriction endonuclease Mrr
MRDARGETAAADRTPITLIDGERLVDLSIDKGIGVTVGTSRC